MGIEIVMGIYRIANDPYNIEDFLLDESEPVFGFIRDVRTSVLLCPLGVKTGYPTQLR